LKPGLLRAAALGLALTSATTVSAAPPADAGREPALAAAARAGRWNEVLERLAALKADAPERYADGRFDYLAARALASTGRRDAAIALFERYVSPDDLFDVPARLASGSLRFEAGDGIGAMELLLPLLQRKGGAVSRRALRIALDALETRLDAAALQRLVSARPPAAPRETRRLLALRAESLEQSGDLAGAEALRERLLTEARRDDAAAVVLAREMRGREPKDVPDRLLPLLVETAKAQRDLDLAERLLAEGDRRAEAGGDAAARWGARFELGRMRTSRGRFAEAAAAFRSILDTEPARKKKPAKKKDDSPGTAAFFARVRFNLGAALEKLSDPDGAAREFQRVEAGRAGPSGLAALQRARLEMRRGRLAEAEQILLRPALAKEPGRVEGLLHLTERYAETGDGAGARRALAPVETLARARRLPEPWKSELPFWRGRVAEASGSVSGALQGYSEILAARPWTAVGELARERMVSLPEAPRAAFLRAGRARGEALLRAGRAAEAKSGLLPAALLGDAAARDLLKVAYGALPLYANVLLAPDLADDALPTLCGDAAACRLLQLGLPEEAEPIVRDASRLGTILGSLVAARLAEAADAGPAALDPPRPRAPSVRPARLGNGRPERGAARAALRRHAPGEPLRPRSRVPGRGARPHAAHAAGRGRRRARAEREPARVRRPLRPRALAAPRRANAPEPPRPLRRRRRARRFGLQRGRGPDGALGRRGAAPRRGAPRVDQLPGDARVRAPRPREPDPLSHLRTAPARQRR
jgi:hypothetical protein